jgi:hypothetical protein
MCRPPRSILKPDSSGPWSERPRRRRVEPPGSREKLRLAVISYGTHYTYLKIGEGTAKPGMEQPVYYWDPVIALRHGRLYRRSVRGLEE